MNIINRSHSLFILIPKFLDLKENPYYKDYIYLPRTETEMEGFSRNLNISLFLKQRPYN